MRKQTQTSNIEATCRIETRLDRSGNKAVIGLERFKREEQPDEIGGVATSLKWRVPPRLRVVTSATSTKGSGTTATCEREESLEAAAGDLVLHAATTHKSY